MRILSVIFALLCAISRSSPQYTYIFEVQDENRGPKSELFGDLSQFKFVPPSQLGPNPSALSAPPAAPAPQRSISRREDSDEDRPRRNQRLSGAAQNQRQFVVRAPQQNSRQEILRQQLSRAQAQREPQYQAQPQTSMAVAQPPPQDYPQLAPHQTAHLNPVLRTINPRNQAPAPAPVRSDEDITYELLQNFVRAQSQPNSDRSTALQTLGETTRYSRQPQPQYSQPRPAPQPQPQYSQPRPAAQPQPQYSQPRPAPQQQPQYSQPQPQPQYSQPRPVPQPQPQYSEPSGRIIIGQTESGLPTLQISNKDQLTEADLRAIEEHNRRVQTYLKQRQQEAETAAQAPSSSPVRSQPLRTAQPNPSERAPETNQNELNERLAAQRAQLQRQNAEQERALREREHQERVARERLLQKQIEQMLRPETRAEVAPVLESLPYIRNPPQIESAVEYATQPQEQYQRRPQPQEQFARRPQPQPQPQPQEQPEVRPLPVSYNNVRVPDNIRRRPQPAPTTPAPRNYAAPRTTAAPRPSNNQNSKPATLGLAALPADTDADGIPGEAGRDYPTLESIPKTSFSCARQPLSGYYADTEAACQVVHLCQFGGVQDSFLCPNGTIWNQEKFSCQWWYEVSCANAPRFYALNQDLYKLPEKDDNSDSNANRNNK